MIAAENSPPSFEDVAAMPISKTTPQTSSTLVDADVQTFLDVPNRKLSSEAMLLLLYRKPRLTLDEVCAALGIAVGTAYQRRARGIFGVPMFGSPLTADLRDVAIELDKLRVQALGG